MTKPPPYPADTRAKGWRFELDYEQIEQSSTWDLAAQASPELRPWLLMMWLVSWKQVPCGSFPADEVVVAAKIGMPAKTWAKHRELMLRGWIAADDGRIYHETISARVAAMLKAKESERQRKADYRARKDAERAGSGGGTHPDGQGGPPAVPQLSHGTDAGPTRTGPGKDDTGTGTGTGIYSEAKASAAPSTAKDRVWTFGPALLGEKGRSLLGQLVNKHGEDVVDRAIASAMREQPGEPKAWLVKACETEAQLQRRAEQFGGGNLLDDPKPQWALDAGFGTRFEAENEGCTPRNAHQFRDGRRVQ